MSVIDKTFWLNRRVLVTGHTGFKGTFLATWLSELGADLIGLAHLPTLSAPLHLAADLDRRMTSIVGDVRDRELLESVVASREPEIIFHLAAQPLVLAGLKNPVDTFDVNVQGTLNLLNAARRSRDLRAIVVVTSDKCYRDTSEACGEDDPLGGRDPYSASKACAEIIAHSYRECYLAADDGIGLATARAGNVIGGGDLSPNRLLPDLVRGMRAGQPVLIRHPHAVRPWQHVLDALHGYLLLAQAAASDPASFSQGFNFGPPESSHWTVGQVARLVADRLGGSIEEHAPPESLETPILRLSAGKAQQRLGWEPRLETREAIEWALEGYRRLLDERDGSWIREQIERYAELDDMPLVGLGHSARGAHRNTKPAEGADVVATA